MLMNILGSIGIVAQNLARLVSGQMASVVKKSRSISANHLRHGNPTSDLGLFASSN